MSNLGKIEGRNPVMEALKSKRPIDKIFVKKGEIAGSLIKILNIAKNMKIPVSYVNLIRSFRQV